MSYKVPFSTKGLQFERQQRNCGLLAKPLLLSDNQTCRRLASRKNLTLRPIVASRKNGSSASPVLTSWRSHLSQDALAE